MKIKNIFGENLDVLIEGNRRAEDIIILVHGFGTDKNEGFSSFIDFSAYFQKQYLVIRFDQSGYGKSEGNSEAFQFQKAAGDVDSVIRYTRKKFPTKSINILAHSLGTFIVALLSPYNIKKIIFTSIPNSNTEFILQQVQNRILQNGGTIDETGISRYVRSSGAIQLVGPDYWRTLRTFNPIEYIQELSSKTKLVIYKPINDEVLEYKYFSAYKLLKGVEYHEIPGDHNFRKPSDRLALFQQIDKFLKS